MHAIKPSAPLDAHPDALYASHTHVGAVDALAGHRDAHIRSHAQRGSHTVLCRESALGGLLRASIKLVAKVPVCADRRCDQSDGDNGWSH
jgi:hypothetical protein